MKFLLVLMALALRELATEEWRRLLTRPLRQWADFIVRLATRQGRDGPLVFGVLLGVPLLTLLVLLIAAQDHVFNFWYFLCSVLVLVPVFMDRRLPSALTAYRQDWLSQEVISEAPARLQQARRDVVGTYFRELFTPLFWFLLFGPLPVLAYYLAGLVLGGQRPALVELARSTRHWLEWLPAQLLVLTFGMAGRFVQVWDFWRAGFADMRVTEDFVLEAALLAEPPRDGETVEGPLALVKALDRYDSLCQRALVIWIVLLFLHMVMS